MSLDIAHEYFTWKLVQEVAEENGYFEEEGVDDADIDYFAPGTQDFDGENAYETDWWEDLDDDGETHGVCEWNAIQEASETGREIIGSYSEWDRVLFSHEGSEIETLDDLKGRSIGINKYATSFYSIPEMLENEGFEEEEIVLEHIGSAEERFDAVKQGDVDSIGVLEPYVTLGRYDEELNEVYEGPCRAALVTREDPDPERVEAFRSAFNRAVEEINGNLDKYRGRYVDLLEEEAESDPDAFGDVNFDELRDDFELRNFLPVRSPDEERIESTTEWMEEKGFVGEEDEVPTLEGEGEKVEPSDD
ncbi:ABC transporter substrate-binding protein [Haladaptatus sp. F3-133]|jgi:ABC-type nitrate/sulfonate/bicarbonate transport system substrate-binding protein|uniref:ABC transporter substrate-binding protein n=1 Tax=Halorutilus salinus TaxID=2487751 RepID=A0A9Q4C491_9EURY|nr:ABC transporter substrate-binding protein [Halorutilus salinus]MCX2818983.1 ABC transporter substrate-binding protein [Halorutilus salinus]